MPPAKIVIPTGAQKVLPPSIIGTTPTAVVAVVRKSGTIRRLPASEAARRPDQWHKMCIRDRAEGARNKEIAKAIAAECGLSRNAAYEIALDV